MINPIRQNATIGGKVGTGFPFKKGRWIANARINPANEKVTPITLDRMQTFSSCFSIL
jgi:hypothetical protein